MNRLAWPAAALLLIAGCSSNGSSQGNPFQAANDSLASGAVVFTLDLHTVHVSGTAQERFGTATTMDVRYDGRPPVATWMDQKLLDPAVYLRMGAHGGTPDRTADAQHPGTHYFTSCSFGPEAYQCKPADLGPLAAQWPDTLGINLDLWVDDAGKPAFLKASTTPLFTKTRPDLNTNATLQVSLSFGGPGKS